MHMMKIKWQKNKGFTLSLALLIISIVLSISLSVSDIILQETVVSGFGRDSLVAFFAADSGVECTLYWDIKQNSFATTTHSSTITCAGSDISFDPFSGLTTFALNFSNGAYASVTVDKNTSPITTVTAYGRNSGDLSNPRRVERGLRVTY